MCLYVYFTLPYHVVICQRDESKSTIYCAYSNISYAIFRIQWYLNQTTANMTVASLCPECITETDIEGLDYGVMYTFDFTKAAKNLTGTHTFIAAYKPEAMNHFIVIEQCCNKAQQIQYQTEISIKGNLIVISKIHRHNKHYLLTAM